MRIFIPTLARHDVQITWNELPDRWKEKTELVVAPHEAELHRGFPYLVCPLRGIAHVRRWILENSGEEFVLMLDDDLKFDTRIHQDMTRPQARKAHADEVGVALDRLEGALRAGYAQANIGPRQNNNTKFEEVTYNERALRALGYHAPTVLEHVELGRVEVMEDFDIQLQLLCAGFDTWHFNRTFQGQGQTQAPGGCSEYRDHGLQDQSARRLAELHPGFVRLRTKHNKGGGDFGTRTEVTIYWKKARKSAGSTSGLYR